MDLRTEDITHPEKRDTCWAGTTMEIYSDVAPPVVSRHHHEPIRTVRIPY